MASHAGGERQVELPVAAGAIRGDLVLPETPRGLVVFAHGSGSSRLSPRNRKVASALQDAGFATMLMDLLTEAEEQEDRFTAAHRFDIEMLAERVVAALDWASSDAATAGLPLGLFGASTGAAAALVAAARRPGVVRAVVSRGGRPDLAEPFLENVRAPTLLIVGEKDTLVLELNRQAATRLAAPSEIAIVPRAGHLFEEPGALDEVCTLAVRWFDRYLAIADT
ncbi:MAG TPA: alpha/beta fold hydrolase [Gemmatimonadaceae bacterium]|nr:alpha/beta fold hydrolase [Gemmatimonadaceae bacterium]